MKYVYVLCEGPTEEGFVNRVLSPYFQNLDTWVTPITITTSKNTSKKAIKGGVMLCYNKVVTPRPNMI